MNKGEVAVTLAVLLLGATSGAVARAGPPPLPASFYGTAMVAGASAPADTPISAWIKDVEVAETSVMIMNGEALYAIDVPADDPATEVIEGGRPGDTIAFRISNVPAHQTAIWQGGINTELNLTATGPPQCMDDGAICLYLPIVMR